MTENHIIHDLDDMIYGNAHVIHSERWTPEEPRWESVGFLFL